MEEQPKSLQELSASKALEAIRNEEHPEAAFRDWEVVQQQLIFFQLLHRAVHFGHGTRLGRHDEYIADDSHAEAYGEPLDQARAFRVNWRYATEEDNARLEEDNGARHRSMIAGERVIWNPFDITRYSDEEPLQALSYQERNEVEQKMHDQGKDWSECRSQFWPRIISSQLMLYRLTATLGPPPSKFMETRLDVYKSCWDAMIVLREEADAEGAKIVNHLDLYDYKGWPSCQFAGTRDGEMKMLTLLNYLVGEDCAHSYDGVRCGEHA